ncbi:hypothetical protein [Halobellus marinus]|uniref:hypothetical protein n=1 Tax=Halobellus TaxID=1073986 RepID=UPI0028A7FD9C|nr:hypothetical protein [Halobellus sp. DFY28]
MSRFRIYGSGGRPVYDSAGEPPDRRLDRIKREFNAGVAMFYDPGAGLVREQVTIHRRSPEQFVATYEADGDEDLLARLVEHVQEVADSRDWTIQHGIGGTQALFDAIADGSAFERDALAAVESDLAASSLDPADLRGAVDAIGGIDLLVPDYETAAATLGYLRETYPEYAVAVTETPDVETIAGADVYVRPSREADGVAPGPEFHAWLDRRRAEAAVDAFRRATESFAEETEAASGVDVPTALSVAYSGSEPVSDLDRRLVRTGESAADRREFRRTLRFALPGALIFGLLAGAFWPGVVPFSPERLPLHLLGLAGGVVWLGAVFWTGVARDDPSAESSLEQIPDTARAQAERATDALSALVAAAGEDAARETLRTTVAQYEVAVEPTGERGQNRVRAVAAATALAAAVGGFLLVVIVLATDSFAATGP